MKRIYLFALLILVGCATVAREDLVSLFGPADPTRFDTPRSFPGAISYRNEVQPILEQRCVTCHACYDAPCQLKLGSYEGITRGATKEQVYDTRLTEAPTTRLFIDADKPSAWRKKGFFPVINEYRGNQTAELQASLIARALDLKDHNPLPANVPAPGDLDFSLDRKQQCPAIEEYTKFEKKNPLMGMPFGLPALSEKESGTLRRWLSQGAPYEAPAPLPTSTQILVNHWEAFFNGDSLRELLVNRYIYEHLFLAHLYFTQESDAKKGPPQYFRLVRSTTPPGVPVQEIGTRRPFEDPHVARPYYRLQQVTESIVEKTHMPYALNPARMARWTSLFYTPNYQVTDLPGYSQEIAANPFQTFAALPVDARYRFMLDEAQFTVMGFIKGPVCRGQTALNVINDKFWVFFVDPEALGGHDQEFLNLQSRQLDMPAEGGNGILLPARRYAHQEEAFLQAKSAFLEKSVYSSAQMNPTQIWNGDNSNPNASLTIFRHFDSASVVKGLQGDTPKTAWIMDYSLLERIHYLLVAGYDVYGSVGHQLNTRLYMDFLRMEGEFNFLTFLPEASRVGVRDYWYRDASQDVKDHVYGKYAYFNRETDITYNDLEHPERELMGILKTRLAAIQPREHELATIKDAELLNDLQKLVSIHGATLSWLPEATYLRIETPGQSAQMFSLLRNTAHRNVTQLLSEDKTVLPAEYTLDVLRGFVGAYPNAFYRIQRKDLAEFTRQIKNFGSAQDYRAFIDRFGVRRTSNDFWALSDTLQAEYKTSAPIDGGILDYNRLENR